MQLHWPDGPRGEFRWALPLGEEITGPAPTRFGLRVRRQDEDAYAVTLLWDSTYRQWFASIIDRICASISSALAPCTSTAFCGITVSTPYGFPLTLSSIQFSSISSCSGTAPRSSGSPR